MEMICIVCPKGCKLSVTQKGKNEFDVIGNKCKRGVNYAISEMTAPTRVITSTVKLEGSHNSRVPVKTLQPIPKSSIFECMKVINKVIAKAPVQNGQVLVENILGTGVPLVATRSVD